MDKIFKKTREKILEDLENGKFVKNSDLILFGLTHLVDYKEQNILTITQSVNNESFLFEHIDNSQKYFMLPEQYNALKFLENEFKNKILLAQTSFGKTMLVKEFIYRNYTKYMKIAFILPTNALSFEVEKDLNETKISSQLNYKIFDTHQSTKGEEDEQGYIFVGTQEKFLALNLNENHFDLVIIDEAYKLNNATKDRDYILNDVMLKAVNDKSTDVILLSPICKINVLKSKNNSFSFEQYKTYFNPVATKYFQYKNNSELKKLISDSIETKTIIYHEKPGDLYNVLTHINLDEMKLEENFPSVVMEYLNDVYTEKWNVVKSFKKGLLIHNGNIPKFLQEYSIHLFSEKNSNLMIATSSVAEGINTKAKNVIIKLSEEKLGNFNDKILIKNLIGRAGRMGIYNIGNIYGSICKEDFEDLFLNEETQVNFIDGEEHAKNSPKDFIDTNDSNNETSENDKELIKKEIELMGINKTYFDALINSLELNYDKSDFSEILAIEKNLSKFLNTYVKRKTWTSKNDLWNVMGIFEGDVKKIPTLKQRIEKYLSEHQTLTTFINIRNKFVQFDLKRISDIGLRLIELKIVKNPGDNVVEILKSFKYNYKKYMLCREESETLSELQEIVLHRLFEFGIETNTIFLPIESLNKICANLKKRFSMYDIRKEICKIHSIGNDEYISRIKNIYFYFDKK